MLNKATDIRTVLEYKQLQSPHSFDKALSVNLSTQEVPEQINKCEVG